jgi:hypothetical protein
MWIFGMTRFEKKSDVRGTGDFRGTALCKIEG